MSSIAFSLLTLEFSTCSFPRNPLSSAALTAQLGVKAISEPVSHPPASNLNADRCAQGQDDHHPCGNKLLYQQLRDW